MEGHPDNVAPALFGGFTLAFLDDAGRPVAVRREVHPDVRVVVFSAHQASSTHHTRGLLPAMVPHADASANAAAAGLLVHALTADPSTCCRPPATGCTRTTARRPCRTRRGWSPTCGRRGSPR